MVFLLHFMVLTFLSFGMIFSSWKGNFSLSVPAKFSELKNLLPDNHAPADIEGSFSPQDEDFLRKPNSLQIKGEIWKGVAVVSCLFLVLCLFAVTGQKDCQEEVQKLKKESHF